MSAETPMADDRRDEGRDKADQAWIEDVRVRAELSEDGRQARIRIEVQSAGEDAGLGWVITDPSGHDVAAGVAESASGVFNAELANPTLGAPRPYELHVGLSRGGALCDSRIVRFDVK